MPAAEFLLESITAAKRGVLLSGASFAGTRTSKELLLLCRSDAVAVDMEAAAVAFAAHASGIPFAVAKTISDRLVPEEHVEDEFLAWVKSAAEHAATVVDCLVDITVLTD
jgi:adenosylhomocysteine nucleosidase